MLLVSYSPSFTLSTSIESMLWSCSLALATQTAQPRLGPVTELSPCFKEFVVEGRSFSRHYSWCSLFVRDWKWKPLSTEKKLQTSSPIGKTRRLAEVVVKCAPSFWLSIIMLVFQWFCWQSISLSAANTRLRRDMMTFQFDQIWPKIKLNAFAPFN